MPTLVFGIENIVHVEPGCEHPAYPEFDTGAEVGPRCKYPAHISLIEVVPTAKSVEVGL